MQDKKFIATGKNLPNCLKNLDGYAPTILEQDTIHLAKSNLRFYTSTTPFLFAALGFGFSRYKSYSLFPRSVLTFSSGMIGVGFGMFFGVRSFINTMNTLGNDSELMKRFMDGLKIDMQELQGGKSGEGVFGKDVQDQFENRQPIYDRNIKYQNSLESKPRIKKNQYGDDIIEE